MGMAASQARYLGLAARKTNCEYQGQQINQARTSLGNQSAELWNQMLGLSVPTAPNTTDYTKTQYSFSDGQNDFEITSMVPTDEQEGYNYAVKYKYYQEEVKGIENINTNPQVQATFANTQTTGRALVIGTPSTLDGANVTMAAVTDPVALQQLLRAGVITTLTDEVYSITNTTTGAVEYGLGDVPTADDNNLTTYAMNISNYKVGNASASIANLSDASVTTALRKIAEDNPGSDIATAITSSLAPGGTNSIYTYTKNGTTYYASQSELMSTILSSTSTGVQSLVDNQSPMNQYYTSTVKTEKVVSDYAMMDDASGTGRFTSIKLQDYSSEFQLNTETTSNDEAYQNALSQYYYDTQQYEKTLADINAKTELIQNEDRTLELRLKQLDTEHNALQTEMEAVKKIITKNVEDTFKTFGG